ncbi:Gfo/Idh/MocA family protein [Microbacterium sp. MPKO10]|uniref:Gfo/Idh/MocA family protein n=1 Tax=Microbacterium sp. MPKO10 TaxID=2989818 RepID=UPI0022356181|nr:Gfo/Idh/MocA family oxidoreductase [Microbacterium sp. MPKO10]MCW4457306.1 Gfo/Idh/MocA family oxidoreductase [Microbacterium sp. MPKO10]
MTTNDIRVAVVGAGMMGADHINRLTNRVAGAHVSAIVEPDAGRAEAAAANAPGARTFARLEDAIAADALDAVLIATPGQFHETVIMPALDARLPILCEKPLTQEPESSRRVLEAEQKLDAPLIQVGFMRRFDREYEQLRELVTSHDAGELVMLRCVHRNPSVPEAYHQNMLITDSVVHEFDVAPWLAGSDVKSVEVKHPRRNSLAPERLKEPILVIIELTNGVLVDVEMNVSIQFGYQVATEAVFEKGTARIGQPTGIERWQEGRVFRGEHADYTTRFADAYDIEVQRWVRAVQNGTNVDGPSAWDGYKVALACEAGVTALNEGGIVEIPHEERPAFYA